MVKKLILFSFLIVFGFSWSQEGRILHKVFTKQDGLDLDYIETMVYDNDGFIWLGGSSLDMREIVKNEKRPSLLRFNGKTFHNIHLPKLQNPITSIRQLYKRKDGKFYVVGNMDKGNDFLLLFDPIKTSFKEVKILPNSKDRFFLSKVFQYQGRDYLISQEHNTIQLLSISENLEVHKIFSHIVEGSRFIIDKLTVFLPFKDFIMIGDNHIPMHYFSWEGKLLKIDADTRRVSNTDGESVRRYIDEFVVQNDTTFVMLYRNPVMHYIDEESRSIKPLSFSNTKLFSGSLKSTTDTIVHSLWVSSKDGHFRIHKFNTSDGFQSIYDKELFDTEEPFNTLSNDVSKELWVSRNKGELHYFKFPSTSVKNYLPNIAMRAIAPLHNDEYIVASETSGWYKLNLTKETIIPFPISSADTTLNPTSSRAFFKEGNTLWSNDGSSIIEVDINTHEAQRHRHYPVISIVKPTDSTFIYGTNGYALMEFNKNTKSHNQLLNTKEYRIFELSLFNNLCVAATNKGVLTYNTRTKTHKLYGDDFLEDSYLLMATHHPSFGFLVGSRSGHIYQFNPESETFKTLYIDELEAGIATILFDKNTMWINTFNGVVAYNLDSKNITRYSEKDGFSHNEANRYSALDTGNGFLMGTLEGLNFFKPDELQNETPKWNLALLGYTYYDEKTSSITTINDRSQLDQLQEITLPEENKTLSLDFALTNNAEGREHTFRYKLNDEDWLVIKEQNISFPNLAAGDYQLQIEALDFSGNRIGNVLQYAIHSKDFFYNQWWFYLLLLLLGSGIVVYLLNQSAQKRKMQEQFSGALLVSQETERTRIAKELHDSIGQQLTLIKRKAQNDNSSEIAALSHKTLEEVRGISRGLYPAFLRQLGLSESIEQLVLEIDEDTSLFCTAEIDDIDVHFTEEKSLNFYRFIQECLNNSLKHSEATNLSVVVSNKTKKIALHIVDNGKGFNVADAIKNNSLGLKTLKERMRLLDGSMQIESNPKKGTNIYCEIPK